MAAASEMKTQWLKISKKANEYENGGIIGIEMKKKMKAGEENEEEISKYVSMKINNNGVSAMSKCVTENRKRKAICRKKGIKAKAENINMAMKMAAKAAKSAK
jgi:hypothetical protein